MSPDRARLPQKLRGFTLIELMVVVFIIGVLIAAVLVGVPKIKKAVYGAQTQAQLSAISGAIQQYYNDYKAYPGPIANSQLGAGYDSSTPPNAYGQPLVNVPNTSPGYGWTSGATLDPKYITGGENLVLGLCGGLRIVPGANGSPTFGFFLEDIYGQDGNTPSPRGPASLNLNLPKKQTAYITLKPGDLSVPNLGVNNGMFTDAGGRYAHDSMIPEFMDKYGDPLPILYYRTNVKATAIVGFRNSASMGGTQMTYADPYGNTTNLTAQYDLLQDFGYVDDTTGRPQIGVIANIVASKHGLRGIGNMNDPIDITFNGTYAPYFFDPTTPTTPPTGKNALAYFKDPSLNDPSASNVHLGVARQQDGYILISAGADRQYGTRDDQVFPGPLLPAQ